MYMKKIILLLCLGYSVLGLSQETVLGRPDIPGELMLDIGLNYWTVTPEGLNQQGWPSKSMGVYYSKRKLLASKVSFNYGLGLGLEKYDLGVNNTLYSGNDEVAIDDFPFDTNESPIIKNRLAVSYLDVPLDIRFHPRGTSEGEGLFLGVGVIGGLRLQSHMKWKYPEDGEDAVQKIRGKYNLNAFRYGLQIRAGFKGTHLFFKQYFSDLFADPIEGEVPRAFTIGINFSGF